eukprot:4559038-Amphidinium_carterae.1
MRKWYHTKLFELTKGDEKLKKVMMVVDLRRCPFCGGPGQTLHPQGSRPRCEVNPGASFSREKTKAEKANAF